MVDSAAAFLAARVAAAFLVAASRLAAVSAAEAWRAAVALAAVREVVLLVVDFPVTVRRATVTPSCANSKAGSTRSATSDRTTSAFSALSEMSARHRTGLVDRALAATGELTVGRGGLNDQIVRLLLQLGDPGLGRRRAGS